MHDASKKHLQKRHKQDEIREYCKGLDLMILLKKKAEIPIIKVSDSFFTQKYLKWLIKTCELNKGDSIHQNVDTFQFQA